MSSDSSTGKSPPKKKNVKYEQKFVNSWLKDDRFKGWLKKSTKGETYFFCSACNCDRKCGIKMSVKILKMRQLKMKLKNNFTFFYVAVIINISMYVSSSN